MLSHRVEGEGPPLLLVHGFGISFHIWRELAPLLRSHFRLVMIELPGIGRSALPTQGQAYLDGAVEGLETLRRELRVTRWAVLGYSSGSRIAEAYVARHPESVTKAIFLCPVVISRRRRGALDFALGLDRAAPGIGTWVLTGWRLKFLISLLGFNLRRDPRSAEWYTEISAAPLSVLKDTIRLSAAEAAKTFSVPVPYAMIWGNRDLVVHKPSRPQAHDYIVHGRHAAPVESPEEIAAVVVGLLEGETGSSET